MTKLVKDTMSRSLEKLQKTLEKVPEVAYDAWVKNTPKQSGSARKKTQLKGNTIHANYAYAQRLDKGWSKQNPNGMSQAANEAVEKYLKSKMRK